MRSVHLRSLKTHLKKGNTKIQFIDQTCLFQTLECHYPQHEPSTSIAFLPQLPKCLLKIFSGKAQRKKLHKKCLAILRKPKICELLRISSTFLEILQQKHDKQ